MEKHFLIEHRSLIAEAADLIHEQAKLIGDLEAVVAQYEGEALQGLKPAAMPSGPLLPGELPRTAPPLPMRENPPPSCYEPLELVVSEKTAIRALVRHYHWVHNGPDILHRYPFRLDPDPNVAAIGLHADVMEQLKEPTGTRSDPAAPPSAAAA